MTFHGLSRKEKINASENMIRKAYYKSSRIRSLVDIKTVKTSTENFLKLGHRSYIPEEWYTSDNIFYDMALEEIGENIAFSEIKYILNEILNDNRIKHVQLEEVTSQVLKDQLKNMTSTSFNPTVMFAPIQFYVDILWTWSQNDREYSTKNFREIMFNGNPFEVFWSNRYMPFNDFIFLDKSFGEWITKLKVNERFFVKIDESDGESELLLTVHVPFKFVIKEPEKIRILDIPELKQKPITNQLDKTTQ